MSRFYKTSSAAPVDYMYKLPAEFMVNVLQNTEGQIDNFYNSLDLISSAANVNYLTPDADTAKGIIDGYSKEIDSYTNRLKTNPLESRKLLPNLRDLSKKLQQDLKTGDLGRIQQNFTAFQDYNKQVDEMVKANKLSPQEGLIFKSHAISKYQGFKDKDGVYTPFSGETPMENVNLNKWMDEQLKNLVASGQITWNEKAGQYFVRDEQGREYKDPNKIFSILYNSIQGDTNLQAFLNQRHRMDILGGIIGDDGALRILDSSNPFTTNEDGTQTPNFVDNALTSAIRGAMGEHSFMKTKGGNSLRNNSTYNQLVAQEHAKDMADINFKNAQQLEQFKSDLNIAEYEHKLDNPTVDDLIKIAEAESEGKIKPGSIVPGSAKSKKVNENVASDTYTITPFAASAINISSLSQNLKVFGNQVEEYTRLRDAQPPGSTLYKHYEQLRYNADVGLNNANKIWQSTYEQARKSLSSEDFALLSDVQRNKGSILAEISQLEKTIENRTRTNQAVDGFSPFSLGNEQSERLQELRGKLTRARVLEEKFNKTRNKILTENSKNSSYVVQGVKPTTNQVNSIMNNLMESNTGFDLFNLQTGQSLDKSRFNNGVFTKGSQMSFQGQGEGLKNLRTYMKENNLTPSDIMNVESILPSAGDNTGMTAVVTFKNIPGLPFDPNTKIGMKLGATTQMMIANTLNGTDKASENLREAATNGQKQYLKDKLATYRETNLGVGQKSVTQRISIPDTKGEIHTLEYNYENIGTSQPGIRAKVITANGQEIRVNGRDIFFNADDLVENFYSTK